MLTWILENMATILICAGFIAVIAAIIVRMVRNQKTGKSACGCGCTGCPMGGVCHTEK